MNGDARPDSPRMSDENLEAVKQVILECLWVTIKDVVDDVGISFGSCKSIFMTDLGMKRAKVKFIPKLQNFEQKQSRMNIAQMLTMFNVPAHTSILVPEFLGKNLAGTGPYWLFFSLPTTEGTDETKAFYITIEEIKEKSKQKLLLLICILLTVHDVGCNMAVEIYKN